MEEKNPVLSGTWNKCSEEKQQLEKLQKTPQMCREIWTGEMML